MKMLLTLIAAFFICCNNKDPKFHTTSVPAADTSAYTSEPFNRAIADTGRTDSLKNIIDSLRRKLFVADYKIQRVKYYLAITINNPSQTKHLKGWIKRAIQ